MPSVVKNLGRDHVPSYNHLEVIGPVASQPKIVRYKEDGTVAVRFWIRLRGGLFRGRVAYGYLKVQYSASEAAAETFVRSHKKGTLTHVSGTMTWCEWEHEETHEKYGAWELRAQQITFIRPTPKVYEKPSLPRSPFPEPMDEATEDGIDPIGRLVANIDEET